MNPLFRLKLRKQQFREEEFRNLYHILMEEYGFIPWGEFRQMRLPMLWVLLENIGEKRKKEQEAMERSKRR